MTGITCPLIHSVGQYSYVITYDDASTVHNQRIRLLLDYRNASKYDCGNAKTGLFVDDDSSISTVDYIAWDNAEHPPMAEPASEYTNWTDESFNTEIVVGVSDGVSDARINLSAYIDGEKIPITVPTTSIYGDVAIGDDCILSGESFVPVSGADYRRLNVLSETMVSSAEIQTLIYQDGVVTVVTSNKHGFSDGDSITVSGVEKCSHSIGVNGERYNGIYYVYDCTDYSFKYASTFSGSDYSTSRTYASGSGPTASKWVVNTWKANPHRIESSAGQVSITWDYLAENNRMIIGDHYYLIDSEDGKYYDATVAAVSGTTVILTYSAGSIPKFTDDSDWMILAPRVPSSDVPVNYASDSPTNIPAYSHSASTAFIAVYDDTTVSSEYDGTVNVSSKYLHLSNSEWIIFKFNPGYEVNGANAVEITCHIQSNTYPYVKLAVYELSDSSWNMAITQEEVDNSLIYDILDSAIVYNPRMAGGTAVRFMITGDVVKKWYSGGVPVSLAIRVLSENTLDSMDICSTESGYPITVVGCSGKQASMNPNLLSVKTVPSILGIGEQVTIYALGDGEFSGTPGCDIVKIDDIVCDIISDTSKAIVARVPSVSSRVCTLGVYQYSGDTLVQTSNTVNVAVDISRDRNVQLCEKITPGIDRSKVSYNASYSMDIAFNGFTTVTDENNLIQNVYNCLLTNKGERLFNQDFGADIESQLFTLSTSGSSKLLLENCISAITNYESRVSIDYSKCSVEEADGGSTMIVNIGIILPYSGLKQLRLPFKYRGKVFR